MLIVEAAFVAAAVRGDSSLAKRIEAAMSQAVLAALTDGITDPAKQKDRILAARAKVIHDAILGGKSMPSSISFIAFGVWFCVGFFTGAGWALGQLIVGRIVR